MKNQEIFNLPEDLASKQPIVLFDGECTFCNTSVRFLLRNNHSRNLKFTSLQSDTGMKIVNLAVKNFDITDSLLLMQDNTLFTCSTAVVMISAHLGFPWRFLRVLMYIPASIRDSAYRYVAKNRYKWFGRKSFCQVQGNEYQEQFLS